MSVFRLGVVASVFMVIGDLNCNAGEDSASGMTPPASTVDAGPPAADESTDASAPACSDVPPRPGTAITETGAVTGAKAGST